MSNYCFTVPILPGQEQNLRKYIREDMLHNADYERIMRSSGVTREQIWIQPTPNMGSLLVMNIESNDPGKAMQVLATSSEPWAIRFRDYLKQVHGLEANQPMPLNEQLFDWGVSEKVHIER